MSLEDEFLPEDVEEIEERFEKVANAMTFSNRFRDWMEELDDIDWG